MDNLISVLPNSISAIFDKSLSVSSQIKNRNSQYIYPISGNNSFSPDSNSVIRFQLMSQPNSLIDLREMTMNFTVSTTGSGGTYRRMPFGIQSVITRFRVLLGSTVLEDIIEYNILYQLFLHSEQPNALSTTFFINEGCADQTQRAAYALLPNKVYSINMAYVSDLLKNIWPSCILTDPLIFELYLSPSNTIMESDQTNVSYSLNNVQLHFTNIEIGEQLIGAFKQADNKGEIQYTFSSWENYVTQYSSGTQNLNVNIPLKKQVAASIVTVNRNLANNTSLGTDNKLITWLNSDIYDSSRYRLNNVYYPTDRVLSVPEAYQQFCEVFDKNYTTPVQLGLSFESGNMFCLAQSFQDHLERYDGKTVQYNPKELLISGGNLNSGSSSLLFELTLKSGIPSDQSASFWMRHYALLKIKNGRAELIE